MPRRKWNPTPELMESMNDGRIDRDWDNADGLLRSYAETGDVAFRNEAVEICLSLAYSMAKKLWCSGVKLRLSEDDLLGHAMAGLIHGAEGYAIAGEWHRPFGIYARQSMWNEMIRANLTNGGLVKICSTLFYRKDPRATEAMAFTFSPVNGDDKGMARSESDAVDDHDEAWRLFKWTRLDSMEREAARINFGLGVDREAMKSASSRFGVTGTTMSKALRRAVVKMRAESAESDERRFASHDRR
jgi:hypothetical protein